MPEAKRILLVEDDSIWQGIYRKQISATQPDVTIDTARTLIAAADLLKSNVYSAIVLDNMFPTVEPSPHKDADLERVAQYGMESTKNNGLEIIRAIRRDCFPLNKQCPIYFHSSSLDSELSGSGKRLGATVCADKGDDRKNELGTFLSTYLGLREGRERC